MNVPFRRLKKTDVEWATNSAKERIEGASKRALQYLTDPNKIERRESQLCVCCFYGDKIGGAAMTRAYCGICNTEQMFSSTYTDKLCKACAKDHGLCSHCTAGIELKISRQLNLPES